MSENRFANIPTKKMYLFLSKKVAEKEITHQEIAATFKKYQNNPGGYLYALKTGVSIQLDHILKAQKHFGLNPCELFSHEKKVIGYDSKLDVEELSMGGIEKEYLIEMKKRNEEQSETMKSQRETIKGHEETIRFLIGQARTGESDAKKAS